MTDVSSSQADDLDSSNSISVVMPTLSQNVPVQSVIHSNQPSVIQTAGPNVQTIQVVRVAAVEEDLSEEAGSKKRRELLSRRPSYRKIYNELSSPVTKCEEESNSSQSQDGESQDNSLSQQGGVQYQQVAVPQGTIHLTTSPDGITSVAPGLQTLTMTNANPTTSAAGATTIVQYTQGPDGQFYIPGAIQLAANGSLSQNLLLSSNSFSNCSGGASGDVSCKKRELRLLKNREAARECRRKKKEYVKCLENRVAVLENQNKTLIDELKTLKELYCQNDG